MRQYKKIIQIIPAQKDIVAVFSDEPEIEMDVICLALVEDEEGFRYVDGIDDDGNPCSTASNFVGLRNKAASH